MITVASTTESPEQIKQDLEKSGFKVSVETTDVSGQTETSAPATDKTAEPGETAAESETAETHETDNPDASAATGDKDKDKKQIKFDEKMKRRLDKATAKWRSEESRRAQLEQENAELRRKLTETATPAGKTTPATAEPASATATEAETPATETPATETAATSAERPKRPRQADFADWDEYEQALDKYDSDLDAYHRAIAQTEVQKKEQADNSRKQEEANATRWQEIATEGKTRYQDWDAIRPQPGSENDVAFPAEVGALIQASKVAPDLLYHLARHPQDARYLAGLPIPVAARELGRLEVHLEQVQPPAAPAAAAPPAAPAAQTPPQVRENRNPRPAPISTVNATTASVGTTGDPGTLTPREYRRRRMAGELR